MGGNEENGEVEAELDAEDEELFEEAELEAAAPGPEPRLRRGLFGYRAGDVRAEIEVRNAEADELRDDVAALWLVFNQHERAIRELIGAVERLGGGRIPPPGERNWDDPDDDGSGRPPDAWVADQMEGLDEVLAAIKQATDLLERSYEEVEPRAPGAAPPPPTVLPPMPPPRNQPPANGSGGNAAERL